ncbi:hypothetical protein [Silvibacterium dinghuense]|uniref:hypothetical protein n=1 Tax=Silvibacterium dinghuense TaxID=1560006 RepID=UPI0019A0D182|nr:hypothetical protein [Silvibacterium dinghuense]GGH17150.1 hypothetical protein GCM10011586_39480 [Silvibacterium dinghuense]
MRRIVEQRYAREAIPIGDRPAANRWAAVGTLMGYILGVSRQNAANGQFARVRDLDRSDFLEAVPTAWSQLDPEEYPFARSVAERIRDHDDRVDFLAGIDVILRGIGSPRRRSNLRSKQVHRTI